MGKRFRVIETPDLPESVREDFDGPVDDEPRGHLCEFDGDTFVRVVGSDGGEPEDQSFRRNWSWVARAMNALAEESASKPAITREDAAACSGEWATCDEAVLDRVDAALREHPKGAKS